MDGRQSGLREITMELHVNWGHASARQLGRVLVDSEGGNMHVATRADEVLEQYEVRRAFDKVPRAPARVLALSPCSMRNCSAILRLGVILSRCM